MAMASACSHLAWVRCSSGDAIQKDLNSSNWSARSVWSPIAFMVSTAGKLFAPGNHSDVMLNLLRESETSFA
ncbi:hypothetical protein HA62_29690 [Pseudomonas putida]|nr:hypothetical protein HA62_29690 [Pseudomonas putida]